MKHYELILICTCLSACYKSNVQPKAMHELVVEWDCGTSIETAEFRFNSQTLGRGQEAYQVLLSMIESAPNDRHILFRYPQELAVQREETFHSDEVLPFDPQGEDRQRFDQLCVRKGFILKREQFKSPQYLTPFAKEWKSRNK
jgi:hypothetical protein